MVMFGNDSDPGVTTLQLTKTYQFMEVYKNLSYTCKKTHYGRKARRGFEPLHLHQTK